MSGSSRERNETYTDNYHEVLCPYCNESNDPWRIHRSARGRCLRVGLRRLRKNIQRASAHFDKRNSGGAAMIPKTQSVCKHCGEPRTSYIHAPDLSDRAHVFEPVSEPASTGEPPPDRYDELQRAGCLVGCYWNYLDSPNQFIEHVEGCPNKIPAARPSEPSAPTVEPIIHARTKVSEGEHLSAPRKSAIEIAGERDLRVITEPIDWEAVENDAAPQTSAEQIEEKLFLYNKEGFEKMPAPQPVSGDAPGDFTEAELVAIERSSFDGSQLWRLARQLRERTAEREAYDSQRKYLLKKLAVAGTQPTPEERELLLAQFFPQGTAPAQGTPEPPKVEELQAIAEKWAVDTDREIDPHAFAEFAKFVLRRYFPPASQTPPLENVLDVIGGLIATYETGDHADNPCGDCVICTAEKILEELATPASTARTDQQLYVISVTGDGGQTTIVPESLLKSEIHKVYCSCGKDWQKCSDEVITNTIAKLDDAEEWTQNYPSYERHVWLDHGEDYTVQVMRVSAPGSVPQAPNNHSDLFFGNLQYSLQTLFAKVGNPFKDLAEWGAVWEALESARKRVGVPQAEPPKEEKQ